MPTSVLLAVLAAAGLLALAPALVRRYDATERLVAERALSTARVLDRRRRRRTVPTHRGFPSPTSTATQETVPAPTSNNESTPRPGGGPSGVPKGATRLTFNPAREEQARLWKYRRRRRVLLALLLLNTVELVGVALFDPGLWIGFAVSAILLLGYAIRLRRQVITDRRRRRITMLRARELAQREAERIAAERAELLAAAEQAAAAARRGAVAFRSSRRRPVPPEQRKQSQAHGSQSLPTRGPTRGRGVRGEAYTARAVNF